MIGNNRFLVKMDKLIALLSAKKIRIVPGTKACTDGKGTIYMPWLPNDATEIDFVKFFNVACHEQSHFYGRTRVNLMSKDKIVHNLENVFDDTRCEYLQEQEYPGLAFYRIKYYKIILDEFVNKELRDATTENMGEFIRALGKYVIIKNRINQLNTLELIPTPSEELVEAYNRYAADFESRVTKMKTDRDAFKLGHELYERIIELIRAIEEEKLPPPPEKSSGDDGDDSEESEKGDDDGSGTDGTDSDSDDGNSRDKSPSGKLSEDDSGDEDEGDESVKGTDDSDDDKRGESRYSSSEDVSEDGGEATPSDDGSSSIEPDDDDDEEADEDREKALKEAIERALEDAKKGDMDLITRIIEEINADVLRSDEYMVDPNVKDDINFNRVGSVPEADSIKNDGLRILGVSGSRMMRLFIDQSKPSYLHYQKSGRFDGTAFISDPLDRRTSVYSLKLTPRLDKAAVSFMMDNSSSMNGVIRKAYAVLSGMTYHLSRGNIPVEAVGFTADHCSNPHFRDTPVQLRIIKGFNEPYSGKVIQRFVVPSHTNQNAEVDCMRFMIPRLMARPEQKKVFFIIGDGMPCIGDGRLNRKLTKAYKEYVDLCRAAGIIVFGFGINCNLSWIFGNDFISVDSEDMGDQIMKKLSKVLNRPTKRIRRSA